jgi:hypothetical protein
VSAEQYVDATAQFWLTGKDKVLYSFNVELLASTALTNNFSAAQPGFAYLVVRAAKCPGGRGGAATTYVQSLTPSQYDIGDLSKIRATTGSFSGGFTVLWTGAGTDQAVDSVPNVGGTGEADLSSGWSAQAKLTGFAPGCVDTVAVAGRHTHAAPHAFTSPIGKQAPFGGGSGLAPKPTKCAPAPRR